MFLSLYIYREGYGLEQNALGRFVQTSQPSPESQNNIDVLLLLDGGGWAEMFEQIALRRFVRLCVSLSLYIYIYIERERERESGIHIYKNNWRAYSPRSLSLSLSLALSLSLSISLSICIYIYIIQNTYVLKHIFQKKVFNFVLWFIC
jgi:hypothetical protein